jgi:hypothetical protein
MYASDLTHRKRAQVVYSDISRQKALFDKGEIMRINYQKGGTDYGYMMELEQGCVNNTCIGEGPIYSISNNYVTTMNISSAALINPNNPLLIEYGYQFPSARDASGNYLSSPGPTRDDAYFPIMMSDMEFYFFGVRKTEMFWSTNCAILFSNPLRRMVNIGTTRDSGNIIVYNNVPAILLGNSDRRLDDLYIRYETVDYKYKITTLFVFYQDFSRQQELQSNPRSSQYQVRIIRELVGEKRQWIEVSVKLAATFSGYIAGSIIDSDGNSTDPTKLSPYNVSNGTTFLNPCGTTFATVGPAAGTSFVFESDSLGSSWIFRNNASIPV